MELLLASPRGFCAGVVRAIDTVNLALKHYGTPLYVRKEIVHNQAVVEQFKARGVHFIDSLDEVPHNNVVIFSAHGVSPEVRRKAQERHLQVVDATCPLVTKVHAEVHKYGRMGYAIVLIGHKDHDEIIGTLGEAPDIIHVVGTVLEVEQLAIANPDRVVALTQTTLSMDESKEMIDALRCKFPKLITPPKDDICYATQNRQDAVRSLVQEGIDMLLVVGSQNSSNSQRLCEVATALGVEAHLIDQASEIQKSWLQEKHRIGLTAGASAPEYIVQAVVRELSSQGYKPREIDFIQEDVSFSLPAELGSLQARPLPISA